MHRTRYAPRSRKIGLLAGVAAAALGVVTTSAGAVDPDKAADRTHTTTPIKHVIVVIAENGGFDHVFGVSRDARSRRILPVQTARLPLFRVRPRYFSVPIASSLAAIRIA